VLGIWDALSVMGLLAVLYLINSGVGSSQTVWFVGATLFHLSGGGVLYVNLRRASVDADLTSVLLPAPYRRWTVLWPLLVGSFGLVFAVLSWAGALGVYATTILTGVFGLSLVAWSSFFVWVWRRSVGLQTVAAQQDFAAAAAQLGLIGAWYRLAADVGGSARVSQRWAAQLSIDPMDEMTVVLTQEEKERYAEVRDRA
jgi:hypothetical protein